MESDRENNTFGREKHSLAWIMETILLWPGGYTWQKMHCLTRQPHTLFSAEPSGSMKNTYRFGTSYHGNIKTSLSERFLSSSGL